MVSLSEAFARALCLADDVIIHELYEAQAILQASPDYLALLSHPLLSPSRKAHLLEEGFAEEAHPQTVAILKEMSRCGLCAKLGEVLQLHQTHAAGIITAKVFTARPLSDEQRAKIHALIQRHVAGSVRLQIIQDETLIAGIRVQCGDLILDGSLASRLERLRTYLRAQEGGTDEYGNDRTAHQGTDPQL